MHPPPVTAFFQAQQQQQLSAERAAERYVCWFVLQKKILAGEARLVRMVAHPNIVRCMQVLETRRQQVRTSR
jgi:hypothetical protein